MAASSQEDQLSALFTRNLNIQPASTTVPTVAAPPAEPNKIVYISQHYTHSAHVPKQENKPPQDLPRASSEPPPTELHDLEVVLRNHGVDTSKLSVPQVELFKAAEDSQKMRLMQLWSIYPPTPDSSVYGNAASEHPSLTWSTTTMGQEEALAKMRMEKQMQQLNGTYTAMSLDGTMVQTAAPVQQTDGRWRAQEQEHNQSVSYMEPYMLSGYEQAMQREYMNASSASTLEPSRYADLDMSPVDGCGMPYSLATDPVYKMASGNSVPNWQKQQMENQYGQLMRGWGDEEML